MKDPAQAPEKPRQVAFQKVGPNLYRLDSTGGYYALLKRADKQFRRSLRTKDRRLAERRLAELREKVGNLATGDDARLTFADVAQRWLQLSKPAMKPRAFLRKAQFVDQLKKLFGSMPIRNVTPSHCEQWVTARGAEISPSTFVQELGVMKGIFAYAVDLGYMLSNPARRIQRPKLVHKPKSIPTREQFHKLVLAIRESDGRQHSQELASAGADLVELLAYSGCLIAEATALRWRDVNFEQNTLTVSGGETGTKNHEARVIPMTGALRSHLETLKAESQPTDDQPISHIASAKKCLETTCKRLSYPKFTHHDFRHFFATTCIEAGVDIPTVSRWLGHKDGGALAMRVYGHLRQDHSRQSALKVIF